MASDIDIAQAAKLKRITIRLRKKSS